MQRSVAKKHREPLILIAPGVVFLLLAFFFPTFSLLIQSFQNTSGNDVQFTLSHYSQAFVDDFYLGVAARTFRLAFVITLICAVVGFPMAVIISRVQGRWKALLILIMVLPLMTSVVIRTFGWLVVLGQGGVLSWTLQSLGLISKSISLMHTETGIVIAMVQVLLPFQVLTILGSLNQIQPSLNEAVRTLGAGFYRAIWYVTLPLSLPGLVSGSLLVFALSISSFITPTLVGGVRIQMLAGSIYQQMTGSFNWAFGSALSVLLLVATLVVLTPYLAFVRRRGAR